MKAKDSETKDYKLCFRNITKDFTINNMIKSRLKGIVKFLSVDFNPIDANDVLDIHKYLMKGKYYKILFGLNKKFFMRLLISIVNASNHTKCVSLSSQKYVIQPALINLHPNEYNQEIQYDPFAVNFGRCVGSCITLNE